MAESEDLLADLPAPHEAEPPSLRQDIADELLDHLQCAARRESLKNSDPQTIEHRVLSRFGNPRKIARKLWFDAMKEKLMMQKVTLALVSLVAVASLAACGLMWSLARDFQSASTEMLSQSREVNAELLSQLSAIANRKPEGPSLMEWVPLKIQAVKNDEAKTPAAGFRVEIQGHIISGAEKATIVETTNESGMIDYGLVRPGYYSATISSPWNAMQSRRILVRPGAAHTEQIIAPAGPAEPIQVKPTVNWPKELEGKDVAVLVRIIGNDHTQMGKESWTFEHDGYLLIRPDGRFALYEGVAYSFARNNFRGNAPALVEKVSFTEPQVFQDSSSWQGKLGGLSNLVLVKLASDADFPDEESLACLSRSWLEEYSPFNRERGPTVLSQVEFSRKTREDGVQEWTIEISNADAWVTKAMLAVEKLSKSNFSAAASAFFHFDKNKNLEISEAEGENADFSIYGEFPVSFKAFVEVFQEERNRNKES